MASPGGSIESISINSRRFPVASDADATVNIGGFSNEVQANGDGSARQVKTRQPAAVEGLQIAIDHDNDDMAFLQSIADGGSFVPFTLTMVSGHVYQGRMQITELPGLSTMNSTCGISLSGPKNLELQ